MDANMISLSCKCPYTAKRITVEVEPIFEVGTLVVVEYPAGVYSVTHRPTGWACMKTDSATKAMRAAKAFDAIQEIDWPNLTPENAKPMGAAAKDRIIAIKTEFAAEADYD